MRTIVILLLLIALSPVAAFTQATESGGAKAVLRERWPDGTFKWTTDVSVSMTEYGSSPSFRDLPEIGPSPDGKYFFVLAYRGDVAGCGCTYRTLSVYDTQVVRGWLAGGESTIPTPFRTVRLSSKGSEPAINFPEWDGAESIAFWGMDEKDDRQIFRYHVPSGKLRILTDDRGLVRLTNESYRDGAVIYRRQWAGKKSASVPAVEPVERDRDGQPFVSRGGRTTIDWAAVSPDGKAWRLPIEGVSNASSWIAPRGRLAVMALNKAGSVAGIFELNRYVMVDFLGKKVAPITAIGIPGGLIAARRDGARSIGALWTADGSEAIIMNAKLPVKDLPDGGNKDAGYLAAYEPATGRWRVLQELKPAQNEIEEKIRSIGWLVEGKELLVTREKNNKPIGGTLYIRQGDKWIGREVDASVKQPEPKKPDEFMGGLKVFVRQSENEPPVLMGSDGKREKAMSPPDPALKGVGIPKMRSFKWRAPDGREITSGLTLPPDFKEGTKLPLVIQNNDYVPEAFLPDGDVPTGLARLALVSKGFAVLNLNSKGLAASPEPMSEGPAFVARIDAVVDALSKEGIVDSSRVGLVGHSRMGWQTHYAVTHPGRVKLVAAGIWDSTVQDYKSLTELYGVGGDTRGYEKNNGGPFWSNKENWLKHDVLFNADRVEAAVLFAYDIDNDATEINVKSASTSIVGAYRANRRPFDFVFLRPALHTILGAPVRKAAMDLTVDWMNFWIQGKEDPDPAKAEQYKRWRMIREKNEQRKAEQAKLGKTNGTSTTAAFGMPTPPAQTQTSAAPAAEVPDETAIQRVKEELKAAGIPEPQNMFPFNSMGYREMYVEKDMVKAEKLFRWNLILFPNGQRVADGLDSLGEYYVQAGDVDKAIEFYTKALELKPTLPSKAKQIIQRLKADPASIGAIQEELRQDYINFTKSNPGE